MESLQSVLAPTNLKASFFVVENSKVSKDNFLKSFKEKQSNKKEQKEEKDTKRSDNNKLILLEQTTNTNNRNHNNQENLFSLQEQISFNEKDIINNKSKLNELINNKKVEEIKKVGSGLPIVVEKNNSVVNSGDKSELHELLAKELKKKFNFFEKENEQSSATTTATPSATVQTTQSKVKESLVDNNNLKLNETTTTTTSASTNTNSLTTTESLDRNNTNTKLKRSSLLEQLIEGRKSWPEHKTVIVEIRNGQKVTREEESDLVLDCFFKTKSSSSSSTTTTSSLKKEFFQHQEVENKSSHQKQLDKLSSFDDSLNHIKEQEIDNSEKLATKIDKKSSNLKQLSSPKENSNLIAQEKEEEEENKKRIKDKQETVIVVVDEEEKEKLKNLDNKSKGTKPPTFGSTPLKLTTRLPYFSYFGKARNVSLIKSADRNTTTTTANNNSKFVEKYSKKNNSSAPSSELNTPISNLSSNSSQKSSALSLASSSSSFASNSKIPLAINRIINQDNTQQQNRKNSSNLSLNKFRGYSNISNLFPSFGKKQMSSARDLSTNLQISGEQLNNNSRNSRLSNYNNNRIKSNSLLNFNSTIGGGVRNYNNINRSRPVSVTKLNQIEKNLNYKNSRRNLDNSFRNISRSSLQKPIIDFIDDYKPSRQTAALAMRRQNSSVGIGGVHTSSSNNINNNAATPATVTRTARQNFSNYNRPSSAAGGNFSNNNLGGTNTNIGRNYRSPSASSLYYGFGSGGGGSAGISPYGYGDYRQNYNNINQSAPIDPDCPVHGEQQYSPIGQNLNSMSRSLSQQLTSGGGAAAAAAAAPPIEADLLYDPYPQQQQQQHLAGVRDFYPSANSYNYYDRPTNNNNNNMTSLLHKPASLYSPTSPRTGGSINYGRSTALDNRAYYNNASRFSVYHHSPGAGAGNDFGGRISSSLASPNEQLRRILGHQPQTKPIHLHPQWAYSRPFIHLQGANNNRRRGTTTTSSNGEEEEEGEEDEDGVNFVDGEPMIRPRFEPFNQLHDAQAIRAVDFHPSGEVYAIGSNSRALRICAYPADHELRHFNSDEHLTSSPRILFKFLQVHRGSIYCVSFNSTGQLLATGSNDQTVHIVKYNSNTHSPDGDEYRLTMHDGTIRDLCFIDDLTNGSSLLLSAGGGDNKIYVTDCDTITPFQSMAGHTQMIMSLHHWSGASFVSASYDRTIRFWDLRTRNCTSIISAPPSIATATATTNLNSIVNKSWSSSLAGPGAPVCSVKVDPSGRLLASGHSDSTCMLYDIRGAKIIQAFKPHNDEIRTVSFSPKSYYLLTGGYDNRIVLTDLQGDLTQKLPSVCVAKSQDKIVQSKWHPSDFTFVTTSADKTATLWALPNE